MHVNTKYWAEQVGLPFHPYTDPGIEPVREAARLLKYVNRPRKYEGLHWTLWTSGTTRTLHNRATPNTRGGFAASTQLGGSAGLRHHGAAGD